MAAMEMSELEDIVEDEEACAPPAPVNQQGLGKQQGFGLPGDACPPMKSLVQRRAAKPSADAATPSRKGTAQDGIF